MNSHVLYRDIVKKAFLLTWRNKFLWLLGFFASLLSLGGLNEMIMRTGFTSNTMLNKLSGLSFFGITFGEAGLFNLNNIAVIAAAGIVIAIMFAVFFYLAAVSFAGLVRAANLLDRNKKTDFMDSFREGKKNFWTIAGINIIGKILIALFLGLVAGVLTMAAEKISFGTASVYLLAFMVLAAASLLISLLIIFSSAFHILQNETMLDAIHESWKLFKKNWVVCVESAAIIFGINLAAKAAVMVFMAVSAIPFLFLLVLGFAISANFLPVIVISFWLIVGTIVMILLGSFFSAFQIVAWTLLFDKIAKGKLISKLHRFFHPII